jgi:hypothetical protein
MMQGEIV